MSQEMVRLPEEVLGVATGRRLHPDDFPVGTHLEGKGLPRQPGDGDGVVVGGGENPGDPARQVATVEKEQHTARREHSQGRNLPQVLLP
jgi:hypothetical protein